MNPTASAKVLKVAPKALFTYLNREGWICYRTGASGYGRHSTSPIACGRPRAS